MNEKEQLHSIGIELGVLMDDLDEIEQVNFDPDVATAIACAQGHVQLMRTILDGKERQT